MAGKVLVYDGDCPICIRGSRVFVRLGLVPEERRRAFQDYPAEVGDRLAAAGFRNEMAVLEPASGEIRTGIPGFLWLLRDGWLAPLARLLDRRGARDAVSVLYHMVSYNRRILAPPRGGIRCACDPDERPGYQLALLLVLVAFTLGAAALFGAGVGAGWGTVQAGRGGLWGVAAGAAILATAGVSALAVPHDVRLRFLAHLAMTGALAAAVLVVAALLAPFFTPPALWLLVALAVVGSLLVVARQLPRRLRYLELLPRRRSA